MSILKNKSIKKLWIWNEKKNSSYRVDLSVTSRTSRYWAIILIRPPKWRAPRWRNLETYLYFFGLLPFLRFLLFSTRKSTFDERWIKIEHFASSDGRILNWEYFILVFRTNAYGRWKLNEPKRYKGQMQKKRSYKIFPIARQQEQLNLFSISVFLTIFCSRHTMQIQGKKP